SRDAGDVDQSRRHSPYRGQHPGEIQIRGAGHGRQVPVSIHRARRVSVLLQDSPENDGQHHRAVIGCELAVSASRETGGKRERSDQKRNGGGSNVQGAAWLVTAVLSCSRQSGSSTPNVFFSFVLSRTE